MKKDTTFSPVFTCRTRGQRAFFIEFRLYQQLCCDPRVVHLEVDQSVLVASVGIAIGPKEAQSSSQT